MHEDMQQNRRQTTPDRIAQFQQRYRTLIDQITDPQIRTLIDANKDNDASAREDLTERFKKAVNTLLDETDPQRLQAMGGVLSTDAKWSALASQLRLAAELLWLGVFYDYPSDAEARQDIRPSAEHNQVSPTVATLRRVVSSSRQLLWQAVEAELHRLRAQHNILADQIEQGARGDPTRKTIAHTIVVYLRTTRAWDNHMYPLTHSRLFQQGFSDAHRLKPLGKRFGSSSITDQDVGWVAQAKDAETELRYQLRDELRRGNARAGKRLSATGYLLQKLTTGYGTKPWLFVRTGLIAILLFTLAFYLNDLFNPGLTLTGPHYCAETNFTGARWWDVPRIIMHYLYLAVTSLSSLGSDSRIAQYCGGVGTQIILILAATTGYFLLALLASLFFQLLTDND